MFIHICLYIYTHTHIYMYLYLHISVSISISKSIEWSIYPSTSTYLYLSNTYKVFLKCAGMQTRVRASPSPRRAANAVVVNERTLSDFTRSSERVYIFDLIGNDVIICRPKKARECYIDFFTLFELVTKLTQSLAHRSWLPLFQCTQTCRFERWSLPSPLHT